MNKKDVEKLLFIGLALTAIVIVVLVAASILAPRQRSTKAEYALECGPQYVKLPKEKCEIKEAK